MDDETNRARYDELRAVAPAAFVNPPGAPVEVLVEPADVAAAEESMRKMLVAQGLPETWARTGVAYADQYMVIVRDAVRFANGRLGTYIRTIDLGDAPGVVVLPRHQDRVVLLHHFRHSTRQWHLEVPRGFGEAGASAEASARRELLEEISAMATRLEPLGVVNADSGLHGAAVHLFYAEVDVPLVSDDEEGIDTIRMVTPEELGDLIRDGEINDGYTIAAFTRARLRGLL